MTNCKMCVIWDTKNIIPDTKYNEDHPESTRKRCKITGLVIKEWDIPNRCISYQISELGKQMIEGLENDKRQEEKYWRDRYNCGKDNIPEHYLNKFNKENIDKKVELK